jgi:predicted nicotinamide N-methyase
MYIVDHCESFTGKTILEVGAGAGLTGLVCSHFAKRVLLTDGNDLVVELLKINTE